MKFFKLFLASEYIDETTLKDTISTVITRQARLITLPKIDKTWPRVTAAHSSLQLPCCISQEEISLEWEEWNADTWSYTGGRNCHSESCTQQLTFHGPNKYGLTDRIHALADKLPKFGGVVEVFWLVGDNTLPPVSEDLGLFGALKRLVEWNHALVWIVPVSPVAVNAPCLPEWLSPLKAAVLLPCQLEQYESSVWNGSLVIIGSKEEQPLTLSGFCLTPKKCDVFPRIQEDADVNTKTDVNTPDEDCLLHHQMELLVPVNHCQVPFYLYSGTVFTMTVPSECPGTSQTRQFLNTLQEDHSVGYLVRLSWGSKWQNKNDQMRKSTNTTSFYDNNWRELMKDSLNNITDPPYEFELTGDCGMFHLLLQGTEEHVQAYLLHEPEKLNGAVGHHLAKLDLEISQESSPLGGNEKVIELLNELPHYAGNSLLEQLHEIEKLQIAALEKWISKNGEEISAEDLLNLLAAVRSYYMELMKKTVNSNKGLPEIEAMELHKPLPEDQFDASNQLERLALELRDYHRKHLAKHKSSDSLAGLSPPPKGPVVTLDAKEFLKLFKPDGTALNKDLTLIIPKSHHTGTRFENIEAIKSPWPECLSSNYHGIYYNVSETAEKLESLGTKLRSRLIATETASTCSQTTTPTTMPLTPKPKIREKENKREEANHNPISEKPGQKGKHTTKRKIRDGGLTAEGKRLLIAKKKLKEQQLKEKSSQVQKPQTSKTDGKPSRIKAGSSQGRQVQGKPESRSQRHKRKLEEVVSATLTKNGLLPEDPLFDTCAKKLYTLTKVFVKDLTTWQSLREEMTNIAESHVQQVIEFEKKKQELPATK